MDTYAERALSVNPNNIDAHFRVAETIEDYYAILDMDPNYYFAMDVIGAMRYYDAPEEVIPLLQKSRALGSKAANMQLGWTYERLGDYKTAWTHYYKSLVQQPDGQVPLMHMGAIFRGEPRIEPIQRSKQTLPPAHGAFDAQPDRDTDSATDGQPSTGASPDWTPTPNETDTAEAAYNAKAEAAKKASQEFQKLQSQSQKEFAEFIEWLEHGINDAPDAQDFLNIVDGYYERILVNLTYLTLGSSPNVPYHDDVLSIGDTGNEGFSIISVSPAFPYTGGMSVMHPEIVNENDEMKLQLCIHTSFSCATHTIVVRARNSVGYTDMNYVVELVD